METLFIYLLKSSGLIAVFYLAYHFLVRKETFFNSNRWFLITGLFTSLLLPLFTIKKIIYIERPKMELNDLVAYANSNNTTLQNVPTVVEAFDWMQFIWISYLIVSCVLVIKIVLNFTSLYRMLYQQQVIKKEKFKLVNLNENIAPFSFFNYIVYNAELYSEEELQSILLHEKIHSQEKHSFDVMVAKLFCIVFWFNPFVWLYKKAITQNLEYIADQKAIQQLEDKKSYQRALLKVVSNQNCLSITNNFYQSLIKKRIVMLNKNQSHKRNSWKYALIIPALLGFVLLFQIKTVAQERALQETKSKQGEVSLVINKNSSEDELKKEANRLKEEHGVTLKYSKIKRNSNGEITGIKVEYKDNNGNKGVSQVNGKEPISPIHFFKNGDVIGFGKTKSVRIIANGANMNIGEDLALNTLDSVTVMKNFDFNFDFEAPEAPEFPEFAEMPEVPEQMTWDNQITKIIIKKDGKEPLVLIDGKVVEGDQSILSKKELEELQNSQKMNDGGEDTQIIINGQDMAKIRTEALVHANMQLKKINPQLRAEMEKHKEIVRVEMKRVKEEMERVKPEMKRARIQMEYSKPEMEKAKVEMIQAKEEMLKARAEMETAKAELEKAKAELNKKSN